MNDSDNGVLLKASEKQLAANRPNAEKPTGAEVGGGS